MPRVLFHPSLGSTEAVKGTCNQWRLWSNCADVQADMSFHWPHKSYCRFCHALAHIMNSLEPDWTGQDSAHATRYFYAIFLLGFVFLFSISVASVAQLDAPSNWRPGGRGFNPRRGRQHSFVEIDHEIFSTVILSLPLIQEGQLSVSGERMCTILVNRLED